MEKSDYEDQREKNVKIKEKLQERMFVFCS